MSSLADPPARPEPWLFPALMDSPANPPAPPTVVVRWLVGSSLQWALHFNTAFRNLPIAQDPTEWSGNCQPQELRWLTGQREAAGPGPPRMLPEAHGPDPGPTPGRRLRDRMRTLRTWVVWTDACRDLPTFPHRKPTGGHHWARDTEGTRGPELGAG